MLTDETNLWEVTPSFLVISKFHCTVFTRAPGLLLMWWWSGAAVWRFAHLCRRIALYRTLEALQDALKSIFTPYCADFLLVRSL